VTRLAKLDGAMDERTRFRISVTGRWLLLVAVVAQLGDAFTFAGAMRFGVPISVESNPVMSLAYQAHGLAGPVELKMALIAVMICLVVLGQRMIGVPALRRSLVVAASALVGGAGLLGCLSNMHALVAFGAS
jgi:hypothetical protein